jgi:hypothetical protein
VMGRLRFPLPPTLAKRESGVGANCSLSRMRERVGVRAEQTNPAVAP